MNLHYDGVLETLLTTKLETLLTTKLFFLSFKKHALLGQSKLKIHPGDI